MNNPQETKNKFLNTFEFISWSLLFFCLPVFPDLVPPCIGLVVLATLFNYSKWEFAFNKKWLLLLPVLFFLYYVCGLLWTEHMDLGLISIERKLSLFVFPFLFFVLPAFGKEKGQYLFSLFIVGALLHSAISLSGALACYAQTGVRDCFFSSAFSYRIHPSYMAMYDVLIVSYILYRLCAEFDHIQSKQRVGMLLLSSWFSLIVILLASKAGLITLFLVFVFFLVYFSILRRRIKFAVIVFASIPVALIIAGSVSSVPLERFKSALLSSTVDEVTLFEKHRNSIESNVVRRMIWIVAREKIRVNPFGAGTGDVNPELEDGFKHRGMIGAIEKGFNAHSQYYQTGIALGYPGMLLLIALFILPVIAAIGKKNLIMIVFLVIVGLNIFVEAMFEVQAGVVFFALFFSFLQINFNKAQQA